MSSSLQFLFPVEDNLKHLNFITPKFEWDGVLYPQGSPECRFGSHFLLKQIDEPNSHLLYIKKLLPKELDHVTWKFVEVIGEGLNIYKMSLFGHATEEAGYTLNDLISLLLKNSPIWIALFEPSDDDGFDRANKGGIEEVMFNLKKRIMEGPPGSPGFLVYNF